MQIFPQHFCWGSGVMYPHATCRQEVWPWRFHGCPKNYIITEILTWQQRRPTKELLDIRLLWALALQQTDQGWEVGKSLSCTRLTKVEKRVEAKVSQCLEMALYAKVEKQEETKMIWCLEIMPDLQKQRSEEKLRWFNALRWPCTSLVKAKWRRSGSYLTPVYTFRPSPTLSYPAIYICTFWVIKGKEADDILIFQHCCCSLLYNTNRYYHSSSEWTWQ